LPACRPAANIQEMRLASPPSAVLAALLALLAPAWAGAEAAAAPSRPPPPARPLADPDAMREVRRAAPAGRFASGRAMGHYLVSRQKAAAGDLVGAAEELRLAVAYDDASAELRAAHAEALALTGRLEAAEAQARKALALDGEGRAATAAHLLLARLHAARREPGPALQALDAAMSVEAKRAAAGERGDPEPWRLAAEQLLLAGDADGALRVLDDAVARIGTDGVGYREVGRALLERSDLPRAERALRLAVERSRVDVEAWHLLADAHEGLHRPREAREDFLAVLHLEPDDPGALLGLGRLALLDDDLPAAREWFARHLATPGADGEAHLRVAFEWLEARHPEEALATARAGLALPGAGPRLRLAEGLALQSLRRWDESAAALEQVPVGAGDAWFSARAALAHARSRAGRHAEALAALEPALAARPGEPRLVIARAEALGRGGRAAEAVEALQAVVGERERLHDEPALRELYPALAEALVAAGRPEQAVAALQQALAARPRDPVLLYALGAAYERAGRGDEAVAQMKALLVLDPEHAEALNFVGFTWAEQGVRLDEAEEMVRRALRRSPRSGHMIDSLGWIRFKKGDLRQAIELLERADRLIGPDPSVLDHLGDAYRAAARPADAQAAWRRALKSVGEEPPAEQVALRSALERKLKELTAAQERRPVAR
jgi:tetratricopeptide (TPR) repeat protein